MTRFLMIKNLLLPMYGFAPSMVATLTTGGPKSPYRDVYTVGEYGQGIYFLTWVAA
jgi:hypothetical protein